MNVMHTSRIDMKSEICRKCKTKLTDENLSKHGGNVCSQCLLDEVAQRKAKKDTYLKKWFFGAPDDYNWPAWGYYHGWTRVN